MKTIDTGRIAELGHHLSMKMTQEYGGLTGPEAKSVEAEPLARADFVRTLQRGRLSGMSREASLIRPQDAHNLARLTSPDAIGRTFGIMSAKQIVHAGIVTDRTRPGELHFTRLIEGGGVELKQFQGVDTLGRLMTEVGGLIQHPAVGTAEADMRRGPSGEIGAAGEIGHALQGLSALTDPATLNALRNGKHAAHEWAEGQLGSNGQIATMSAVAVALTQRNSGVSAFAVKTDNGETPNGFAPEMIITQNTSGYFLVDHHAIPDQPESSRLGITAAALAAGMGMLAAESQLELSGVMFDSQVMSVMKLI